MSPLAVRSHASSHPPARKSISSCTPRRYAATWPWRPSSRWIRRWATLADRGRPWSRRSCASAFRSRRPRPLRQRDGVPERPSQDLERAFFAPAAAPAATTAGPSIAVVLPRDWVPSTPASEERFPFLQPPPPLPVAPAEREVIVQVPHAAAHAPLLFSVALVPRFPQHRLSGAALGAPP